MAEPNIVNSVNNVLREDFCWNVQMNVHEMDIEIQINWGERNDDAVVSLSITKLTLLILISLIIVLLRVPKFLLWPGVTLWYDMRYININSNCMQNAATLYVVLKRSPHANCPLGRVSECVCVCARVCRSALGAPMRPVAVLRPLRAHARRAFAHVCGRLFLSIAQRERWFPRLGLYLHQ